MRIVFIITGLHTGGAELMLKKLVENLPGNIEPYVISLIKMGEVGIQMQQNGIKVEALGMSPRFPNPIFLIKLVYRIRQLKPQVVHTWMYHADLFGGLAAVFAGVPILYWCIRHTQVNLCLNKFTTNLTVRSCIVLSRIIPRKIVCCSYAASKAHIAQGYCAAKMVIISNGYDLNRFKPDIETGQKIRDSLGIKYETPVVGIIGRFHPQKNHIGFIKAAQIVITNIPETMFIFVGKNLDKNNNRLWSVISSTGLNDAVHLLGLRNDIPSILTSFDLLASPSIEEAFPNAIGEAMCCEVPCIVSDAGDSRYIVGDTGAVVPVGDMVSMAKKIIEFLKMVPEERKALGKKARMRMKDNFELSKIIKLYADLYTRETEDLSHCVE